MKHENKIKMAKSMLSREDIKKGVRPFYSDAWHKRKVSILKKEVKKHTDSVKKI